jgi:hypothetical protein
LIEGETEGGRERVCGDAPLSLDEAALDGGRQGPRCAGHGRTGACRCGGPGAIGGGGTTNEQDPLVGSTEKGKVSRVRGQRLSEGIGSAQAHQIGRAGLRKRKAGSAG